MSLVPTMTTLGTSTPSLACCICNTVKTGLSQVGAIPNACVSCREVAHKWNGREPLPSQPASLVAPSVESVVCKASTGRATTHTPMIPWTSLSDLELSKKLYDADESNVHSGHPPHSFIRYCISGLYGSDSDIITQIVFPYIIKMDRVRISSREFINIHNEFINHEITAIETEMFAELKRRFPSYSESYFKLTGQVLTLPISRVALMRYKISAYHLQYTKEEQTRRAEETAKTERERMVSEITQTIDELGEIRKIGKGLYIVKNGEVFEINSSLPFAPYIIQSINNPRCISSYSEIISKLCGGVPTPTTIAKIRGSRLFASVEEAIARWDANEEAQIIAEARRRIVEEERIAATAEKEKRIQSAMNKLRTENK